MLSSNVNTRILLLGVPRLTQSQPGGGRGGSEFVQSSTPDKGSSKNEGQMAKHMVGFGREFLSLLKKVVTARLQRLFVLVRCQVLVNRWRGKVQTLVQNSNDKRSTLHCSWDGAISYEVVGFSEGF